MIKAICFDFDGVICNICKGEYYSDRLQRKYGVPSKEFIKVLDGDWKKKCQIGKMTLREVWQAPLKKWKLPLTLKQFFENWFGEERLDKEVLDFIDKARKKAKVFLLTNNCKERMDFYNRRDKLYSHFDEIIISGDIGAYKTSKKAADILCSLSKAKPKEIIIIDDSRKNLPDYAKHGFNTILYTNFNKLKKDLKL